MYAKWSVTPLRVPEHATTEEQGVRGTPGEHRGPYVLEARLGSGKAGEVWSAQDASSGAHVVLDLIDAPEHPDALVASLRPLLRLEHPNLARVLGCGHDADAVVWLASERLEGPSLRERLREGPLEDWRECLPWIADIASALANLHAHNILHRDLEPGNVILVDDRAVLVGFGTSPRLGLSDLDTPTSQDVLNTMAPEVLLDGWRLDARADLYALGCIFYELLTGRRVVNAQTPRDILALRDLGSPVRVDILRPEIPKEIALLIDRLLSPQVNQRPGYADEVLVGFAPWIGAPTLDVTTPPHLLTPRRITRRAPERQMRDVLDHFSRGEGGLWVITGRAGAGKSRLLREMLGDSLFLHARPGMDSLILRAKATRAEQQTPLGLLSEFWEDITAHLGPRGMPEQLARFLQPEEHGASPKQPPGSSKLALFQGLDGVFRQLLDHRPVILVLDDLQWADDLTLEWLRSLLTSPGAQTPLTKGLIVVTTARHALVTSGKPGKPGKERARLGALLEVVGARQISLEPMTPDELRAMLRSMLGCGGLAKPAGSLEGDDLRRLLDAIIARAQGSPFQASEMLRAAVRSGALGRDQARWSIRDEALLLESLEQVVFSRLAKLTPKAHTLAQNLALLERGVSSALAESLGDVRCIDELLGAGFLERGLDGRLAFVHDRLRETTAASIDDDALPARHARLVEVLEEVDGLYPGELAHHLLRAGEHERALRALLEIAREPTVQNAQPHRALSCYREIITLDESHALLDPHQRADVEVERVRLMSFAGDKMEAIETARALLEKSLAPSHELELWWCLAHSTLAIGEIGPAWEALGHALRLWEDGLELADCQDLGGRLHWLHGYMLRERGQFEPATRALEQALAFTQETGDLHTRALAHRTLGLIGYDRRVVNEADEHLFEALRLLREVGDRRTDVEVLVDLASVALRAQDREKATAYAEAADARYMAMIGEHHARALSVLAVLARQTGRFNKAVALNQWACDLFEQEKNQRSLAQTLINLGVALQNRGDLLESIEVQRRAANLCQKLDRPQSTVLVSQNTGTTWMRLGRLEEARRAAEEAMQRYIELGDEIGVCKANWNISMVLGLGDEHERAYLLTEEIYPTLLAREQWDVLSYLTAFQGWLRCEQGRFDEARERFERVQDILSGISPQPINVVRCLTLRGRFLRMTGEVEDALAILTEARQLATRCGATYESGHIDCELAALVQKMGESGRAQVLLDRAQRLAEILACEDRSWLGRGVLEAATILSR